MTEIGNTWLLLALIGPDAKVRHVGMMLAALAALDAQKPEGG